MISPLVINNDPRIPLNQLIEADIVYVKDFTKPENISDEQLKHLALISHACYKSFDLSMRCIAILEQRGAIPVGSMNQYPSMISQGWVLVNFSKSNWPPMIPASSGQFWFKRCLSDASCSGGEHSKDAPSLCQSTLMTDALTTALLVSVKYFFQINPIQRACWFCEQSFHMALEPDDWKAKLV